MARKTRLDDLVEFAAPSKRLLWDLVSRTDAHQYLTYLRTHLSDYCIYCPYAPECPPCPYEAATRAPPRPQRSQHA